MGKIIRPQLHTSRFWWLTVACCLLPDVDVIGLIVGIPYEHVMGHRGFSHSLLFAVMCHDWPFLIFHFAAGRLGFLHCISLVSLCLMGFWIR
jgi:membrane-bound metal-dependent hydrolase YbcI (DUF457 family)